MKAYILFLCITLVSCSTVRYQYAKHEYPTGDWKTRVVEDDFEGSWRRSYVKGKNNSDALLFIDSYQNDDIELGLRTGDGYICSQWYGIKAIFDKGEPTRIGSTNFSLSENKKIFWFSDSSPFFPGKSWLLSKLEESNSLKFRTIDSCGTVIDLEFSINGRPHVTTAQKQTSKNTPLDSVDF